MAGQILVTLIDRDSTKVSRFFDSVSDARAFVRKETELGARKARIAAR